jgi:penicillin-binding protein 1A
VTSLLKSVVDEGTGRGAQAIGKPLAGKTGTTNNYVDAWFVGYAPSIVTGVWVGYDNAAASLGDKETGARAALPIWIPVMARALQNKPAEDFTPTDDVVFLKIDPESGLLAREDAQGAVNDVFRRGTERRSMLMSENRRRILQHGPGSATKRQKKTLIRKVRIEQKAESTVGMKEAD